MPVFIIVSCALMLFIGLAPLPYGYYMLLRIVACGVFIYATLIASRKDSKILPWLFALVAILFNPLFKIHFNKEIWMVIDGLAGMFLLLTINVIKG